MIKPMKTNQEKKKKKKKKKKRNLKVTIQISLKAKKKKKITTGISDVFHLTSWTHFCPQPQSLMQISSY